MDVNPHLMSVQFDPAGGAVLGDAIARELRFEDGSELASGIRTYPVSVDGEWVSVDLSGERGG